MYLREILLQRVCDDISRYAGGIRNVNPPVKMCADLVEMKKRMQCNEKDNGRALLSF